MPERSIGGGRGDEESPKGPDERPTVRDLRCSDTARTKRTGSQRFRRNRWGLGLVEYRKLIVTPAR
jgi:hypothetical protein